MIGILTDRAPILLKIGAGELTLHGVSTVNSGSATTGKDAALFVAGGVAQMKDNVLTVLTRRGRDDRKSWTSTPLAKTIADTSAVPVG